MVAILLTAVALAWLAWHTLERDRALERRSIHERLQNVANAVAMELDRRLKELSQQLQVVCRHNSVRWQIQAVNVGAAADPCAIDPGP